MNRTPTELASTRKKLIEEIGRQRGSTVLCYLTSLRQNVPAAISDDAVRVIFDHLRCIAKRPIDKLDVFLSSNGGDGVVPWRLVSLFREFARSFNVLVPYRAYSAASLLALGADEIVMHPFGELGPIDPTVSNDFNPVEPKTGQRLGISVEDVRAYVNFVKSVGITHEDELIQALQILAEKVHPLALGNVERFVAQSRMMAGKVLRTHMKQASEHDIRELVENMASKLYFHGHPINRREARDDLKLKVKDPDEALENAMWDLYLSYEEEFRSTEPYNPLMDLAALPAPAQGLKQLEHELLHAVVESSHLTSKFFTRRRFELLPPLPGQPPIHETLLSQGWNHSPEVEAARRKALSLTKPADAPAGDSVRTTTRSKTPRSAKVLAPQKKPQATP